VGPAAAPVLVDNFSTALPFLNPRISDQMAVISAVMAFVAGVGTLQFTKSGAVLESRRATAFVLGLFAALICVGILLFLSTPDVLNTRPAWLTSELV
jgi:hypothetical protein